MNELLKVFVYGTLKPGQVNYTAYCQGRIIEEKKAYTFGRLYYLKALGYPAMTPGTHKVYGYLLVFNDFTHLQQLDRLEGYQSERSPEENEYQRKLIHIYADSDTSSDSAWAYLMTPDKIALYQGIVLESGYFKADC